MVDIKVLSSGSRGNAVLLDSGTSLILLDAGIPVKKIEQAVGYDLSKISLCCVTHEHMDHARAVKDLIKKGVPVFTSDGTAKALGIESYMHGFSWAHAMHRALKLCTDAGINVGAFHTIHDAAEPWGFIVGYYQYCTGSYEDVILYITDTEYVEQRFKHVTRVLIECNYDERIIIENRAHNVRPESLDRRVIDTHMGLETCLFTLAQLQKDNKDTLREIYLIHTSDTNLDRETAKEAVQKATGLPVYIF